MIVTADKFLAMISSFDKKWKKYTLNINDSQITPKGSAIFLSVEIANKLNFEKHISTLCKKASKQLNAVSRIHHYISKKEKEIIINFFVHSDFKYYPVTCHFCSKTSKKLKIFTPGL